ncbi:MAG: M20 family metallopeptidase [Phycisphaerae bacterium]
MSRDVDVRLKAILPDLIKIRHYIHQHPEIRFEEVGTAALVERELRSCGVEARRIGRTGVVGLIRGRRGGRCVALRADMDALEMAEETGLPYASTNGRMHACGHDGHTTILLGAARILSAMRGRLPGAVKLIFQPAEERGGGALELCRAGVMRNPRVDAIFGLHGFSEYPLGAIAASPGPVMAACDTLYMTVTGRGAHGGHPHQGIDPVVVAARIIEALQTIASREIAPIEPVVVSVTKVQAGFTANIIPERVEMLGTIRTISGQTRQKVFASIRRIAAHTAAAHGAKCRITIEPGYPVTVNHDEMTTLVRRVGAAVLGAANVHQQRLSMGAEDFSYYLAHAPGCFFRLGLSSSSRPCAPMHSSHFDFNDKAIAPGVRMMVGVAMEFLRGR